MAKRKRDVDHPVEPEFPGTPGPDIPTVWVEEGIIEFKPPAPLTLGITKELRIALFVDETFRQFYEQPISLGTLQPGHGPITIVVSRMYVEINGQLETTSMLRCEAKQRRKKAKPKSVRKRRKK